MNTAILLSGGIGSRLHSDVPKQYIAIGGRMLITYSLASLAESPFIDKILIVAEQEWRESILLDAEKNRVPPHKVMGFAMPGFNRQSSIINGMQEILCLAAPEIQGKTVSEGLGNDTVFIHDAARPMLSQKQVADCFGALSGHDGVMPVLPMKDTVYLSRDRETVSELLDREQIFAGQAPELFRFQKYYRANKALTAERLSAIHGSAEPAVLAGMDIVMIPGDEKNFKVTTPEDLERFHSLRCGENDI